MKIPKIRKKKQNPDQLMTHDMDSRCWDAMHTFKGRRLFRTTQGPVLKHYIDIGVFSYREEERIQQVILGIYHGLRVDSTHSR